MLIHSAVITGSVQFNNTDVSGITNVSSFATTSSVNDIQSKTGSFTSTSSFGAYTSSNDTTNTTQNTRLSTIESVTGSYTSTSSFGAYSSSINTFTSSATTRLNTIESVTGSFASTSSVNNLQSVTGSFATTSSFTSYTSSNDGKVNAVIAKTGSFATTGSNAFTGSQTITGSLTATGTITAQTLVVQTITSSVEYSSGSNVFGSLSSNTHQFTGSVLMSGSLTVTDFIRGTCTTSYNGDGIRVYATAIGAGGSQPGIGFWTAAGSKRFITQLDVSTDTWNVVSAAGANLMTINQSGSVGIGTTAPSYTLDVTGTARVSGAATFSSSVTAISLGIGLTAAAKIQAEVGNTTSVGLYSASGLAITSAGGSTGNVYQIAFGYGAGGATYGSSALYGTTESSAGYNTGALVFATRSATTDTAPTEKMRITSAGNVGIGTTTPSGGISGNELALHLAHSNVPILALQSTAASGKKWQIYSSNEGSLYFRDGTAGTQILNLQTSGNVLIGTTTDGGYKLEVAGTMFVQNVFTANAKFSSYTTDGLFNANSRPCQIITPSGAGRILLGYNDYGAGQYYGRIGFYGPTNWSLGHIGSAGNDFSIGVDFRGAAFYIYSNSNYSFAGSNVSDSRKKANINYITSNQLDTILKLKPVSFNQKDLEGNINSNTHTGFIAQDVLEENIPNLVHGSDEGGYGLDYNGVLALAVKAIQELKAEIDILKQQ